MVTKEQALTAREFHENGCCREIGPKGGTKDRVRVWRRNGATKTWKRSPERFQVPVKFGLYDFAYLTNENCQDLHVPEECPLLSGE